MLFNLLKNRSLLLGKTIVVAASSCMLGCTLEPYIITAEEEYTRNFIKDFGLIDPNQDWNLAKAATVKVNLGDNNFSSVKIYGKHGDNYYLIADLTDISGKINVPVDVPESCTEIMVKAGGRKYYGSLDSTINCSDMSRGVPDVTYNADGTAENPNPAKYTGKKDGYYIEVKHTKEGGNGGGQYGTATDGYQYFNTQQISPLISTVPWTKYYSLNTKGWSKDNINNEEGLLPESGVFNRVQKDLTDMIERKKRNGADIVADFRINTGADGKFTLFPYYYGTNLKHELGVYLMDEKGNPIINKDSKKPNPYDDSKYDQYTLEDFVYFPVFIDRDPGDLQIQPHYDSSIEDIGLFKNYETSPTKTDKWTFIKGETVNIQQYLYVKVNNNWIKYDEYFKENGSKTHSRVAYHFWVNEVFSEKELEEKGEPVVHATVTKDGNVTALNVTGEAYAEIGIATKLVSGAYGTKLTGPAHNITYEVVEKGTPVVSSEIKTIEIAEKDKEFDLPVGETREIDVTLKDANGNVLSWDKHFGELKVTKWYGEYIEVFKDNNDNKIKVTALEVPPANYDQMWPQVYVGEDPNTMANNNCYAGFHVTVTSNTTTVTKSHSFSQTYTGESAAMKFDPTWYGYFEPSSFTETEIMSNQTVNAWTRIDIEPDKFAGVDNACRIVITLDKVGKMYLAYSDERLESEFTYVGDGVNKTSSGYNTDEGKEFEIFVNSLSVEKLKAKGLGIFAQYNDGLSIKSVTIKRQGGGETKFVWTSTGKVQAANALEDYYKNHVPESEVNCSCGETHNFSDDATVRVEISDEANRDNINYSVTWAYTTTEEVEQTKVARKNRTLRSRSTSSRADNDMPEFLNNNGSWQDVKPHWSRYLPKGEEVASFPTELPMLARSRGYDVILEVEDENGKKIPYVGNLGMYLKMLSSYEIDQNGVESNPEKNKYGNTTGYVVFSQRKFNKTTEGNLPSNQISALSVKHPVTGRTFLTFEDMPVTRLSETYNSWDYSSDRDVNDLIFNITNYGSISNDKEEIVEKESEEGFSWLWAVEDLGATDDFDFNDMVMKITSVTKNKTTTTTDTDGNDTSTTVTLYKKVTFTPLCAGGTLPLYVHYKDYILRPGVYKEQQLDYDITDSGLKDGESIGGLGDLRGSDDASEIHKWFGNYPHTAMINTSGGDIVRAKSCVLYLNTDFTIEGFGSASTNTSAAGGADGIGGLSVSVNDDRATQMGEISADWKEEGNGWVIAPAENGKVSQMFMVHDAKAKWRWPTERTHILEVYPNFKNWVQNKNTNDTWYNDCRDNNKVIERYDLKK